MAQPRIVIAGHPKSGKTTLCGRLETALAVSAHHTDDLISLGWSEASAEAARLMLEPGPLLIEGVATVRAARKALELTAARPFDVLIYLAQPWVTLSKGQAAMGKGVDTVFQEIRESLVIRGVTILDGSEGLAYTGSP